MVGWRTEEGEEQSRLITEGPQRVQNPWGRNCELWEAGVSRRWKRRGLLEILFKEKLDPRAGAASRSHPSPLKYGVSCWRTELRGAKVGVGSGQIGGKMMF